MVICPELIKLSLMFKMGLTFKVVQAKTADGLLRYGTSLYLSTRKNNNFILNIDAKIIKMQNIKIPQKHKTF